jgi:hypothetical protein
MTVDEKPIRCVLHVRPLNDTARNLSANLERGFEAAHDATAKLVRAQGENNAKTGH